MSEEKTKRPGAASKRQLDAKRSGFDGGTLALLGLRLVCFLMSVLSLGIAAPWAICIYSRYTTKHTLLNGRRLAFTGKGSRLAGRFLLRWLLSILTVGLCLPWLIVTVKRYVAENKVYADHPENTDSGYTATTWQWLRIRLWCGLLTVLSLGLALPWIHTKLLRFEAVHTRIGGSPLIFGGKGSGLLGECLRLLLLAVVTVGVYGFFFPVRYRRWRMKHTSSLSETEYYAVRSRTFEQTVGPDAARIRNAHTECQLERVKSGVTGEEDEQTLRQLAEAGNRSAVYELALKLRGEKDAFEGEAREMLKKAAVMGYPPAMADYAGVLTEKEGALYARLLEDSAFGGCMGSAWLLKNYYEGEAYKRRSTGDYDSAQQLQKAAYWYGVALELCDGDALRDKNGYERIVQTIGQWMTDQEEAKKPSRWPAVLLTLLVLAGCAAGAFLYFKDDLTAVEPEIPDLQLWRGESMVDAEEALFRNVPWEPGVVTFEYLEIRNTGEQTMSYRLRLDGAQAENVIYAAQIPQKISKEDLESVMRQDVTFVPLSAFAVTGTLTPGESIRFSLVLYWEGGENAQIPEGMSPPQKLPITFTLETVA